MQVVKKHKSKIPNSLKVPAEGHLGVMSLEAAEQPEIVRCNEPGCGLAAWASGVMSLEATQQPESLRY